MEYLLIAGGIYSAKITYDYFYGGVALESQEKKKKEILCQELQNYNREKLKPVQRNKNNNNSNGNELQMLLNKKFKNANGRYTVPDNSLLDA
jgi:hypothetical protein